MSSQVEHHDLYILVSQKRTALTRADRAGRSLSLKLLRFLDSNLHLIIPLGVNIATHKIDRVSLGNPRVTAAMRHRGIESLPALVTPHGVVHGADGIRNVYAKNIRKYGRGPVANSRDSGNSTGSPEDSLAAFYKVEMATDGDGEDESIGEGDNMMSAYNQRVRDRSSGNSKESHSARGAVQHGGSSRPDNIDHQSFESGFSGNHGGPDGELDGGGSAQDDIMEQAYWANQESSM